MPAPTKSYLTMIKYGSTNDPSSASWTPIATVLDVKPPKVKADDIETTVLDSPNEFKEWVPGYADGGEFEASIRFDKTQMAALYALFRQQISYQIQYPDGTLPPPSGGSTWGFAGYMNGVSNEVEKGKIVTADITVKVQSKPIFTPGS